MGKKWVWNDDNACINANLFWHFECGDVVIDIYTAWHPENRQWYSCFGYLNGTSYVGSSCPDWMDGGNKNESSAALVRITQLLVGAQRMRMMDVFSGLRLKYNELIADRKTGWKGAITDVDGKPYIWNESCVCLNPDKYYELKTKKVEFYILAAPYNGKYYSSSHIKIKDASGSGSPGYGKYRTPYDSLTLAAIPHISYAIQWLKRDDGGKVLKNEIAELQEILDSLTIVVGEYVGVGNQLSFLPVL